MDGGGGMRNTSTEDLLTEICMGVVQFCLLRTILRDPSADAVGQDAEGGEQ